MAKVPAPETADATGTLKPFLAFAAIVVVLAVGATLLTPRKV